METVVINTELDELEEFSKTVMQLKALHYDMYYIDFFLKDNEKFPYKNLKKILETRQIKTVFNCLKKHGMPIRYDSFCEIVREGNLKEKKRQKKEVVKNTQPEKENPIKTPQREKREKPKTLAEIKAETDAFFKASQAKPSAAVQRQIDKLKKENAERLERERRKNNAHSDS